MCLTDTHLHPINNRSGCVLERMNERSERSALSVDAAPDALLDVPPSAKLVAKVLETEGELTQEQLAAETLLPTRTARYAVGQLEERDLVTSRVSLMDARKRYYSLNADRFPELVSR